MQCWTRRVTTCKVLTSQSAMHLVAVAAVTGAVIESNDGHRWCIVLLGREECVLKSARRNPKAFAKIETALAELQGLGLRHAEIEFKKMGTRASRADRRYR
jgi:hypothetical protein